MDGPIRVLHVDDEPDFAEVAAEFLRRRDGRFEMMIETDPAAALERLSEENVDCVVSDYEMPSLDGLELLERIREQYPDLPFVLYTSEGSEQLASEAISAGVTDYLQKESGTGQYAILANRIENAVEQYRARRILSERTRQLERLYGNLPGIVYRCKNEPGWPMEHLGGAVEELTGYAAAAIESGAVSWGDEVVHPDDSEETWEDIQGELDEGDSFETTYRIVTKEGETKWMWEQGTAVSVDDSARASDGGVVDGGRGGGDTGGESLLLEGFITDVTDQREHERKLQRAFDEVEGILEGLNDAVFLHDLDGTMLYVNDAAVRRLGYSREELLEMTPREYAVSIGDDEYDRRLEELKAEGSLVFETVHLTADGERIPAEINATITTYRGERAVLSVARDVTEQKRREAQRRRRNARITALHDVATEIGSSETREEVYEQVVNAAEDILSFDIAIADAAEGDTLLPMAVSSEISTDQYYDETDVEADDNLAARAYRTGESSVVEDLMTRDAAPADTAFRSAITVPIGDHGVFQAVSTTPGSFDDDDLELVELLVAHATSRLEQLDRTRRLRRRTQQLKRQNERLDEFASIVSHDLRNPLSVASGRLDLAREECDSPHLEDVSRALDRSEALIEDLLTLARKGTGVDELEPVDLGEIAEGCWTNVETDDATVRVETGLTVRADESRLRQLLENLFRNAVEHGSTSSRTPSDDAVEHGRGDVTVIVGDLEGGDGFYVEDDGPGIPDGEHERVFETGYTTANDGTGLGLSIVQRIAEAHGWEITASDGEAGGARFEISGVETTG
ncbi:PAS domain S-box protein [Halalkaliarchaeum sp. AArc-GB]|uniref:hybrid sensor histidine kinase/response regulator n=1 Tax=Halalkaliarchaeum sp. AArc-GB TaxID=3074078 RepID=UPI002859C15F|nr:PAS domain S-box protein [Halalkaliarchaeum sp. AArc-GB]MDR5674484.1 PAS domain S-box protein [Halalkaliarchaeum sp. AArc-GB]